MYQRQRREWKPKNLLLEVAIDDAGRPGSVMTIVGPSDFPLVGQELPVTVVPAGDTWKLSGKLSRLITEIGQLLGSLRDESRGIPNAANGEGKSSQRCVIAAIASPFSQITRLNLSACRRCLHLSSGVFELASPLAAVVQVPGRIPPRIDALQATVVVPHDAPSDVTVSGFVRQSDGAWYQSPPLGPLAPGTWSLAIPLSDRLGSPVTGMKPGASWTSFARLRAHDAGLVFASASANRAVIGIDALSATGAGPATSAPSTTGIPNVSNGEQAVVEQRVGNGRSLADHNGASGQQRLMIADLEMDGVGPDGCAAATGERWTMPVPSAPWFSHLPDHASDFSARLIISDDQGEQLATVAAFHRQPLDISDRGDAEEDVPSGRSWFEAPRPTACRWPLPTPPRAGAVRQRPHRATAPGAEDTRGSLTQP